MKKPKVIDSLLEELLNMSALARVCGCSPATLCIYKSNPEKLKTGKAQVVARLAKYRRLSVEQKAQLMDELAE